jgi:hypothetical protein
MLTNSSRSSRRRRVANAVGHALYNTMPAYRTLQVAIGVALSAMTLVVASAIAGATPSTAAPAQSTRHAVSRAANPDPSAPHAGTVAGRQGGAHISLNNPASLRTFRDLHRQLLPNKGSNGTGIDASAFHSYVGTSFQNLPNSNGAQATQSVSTKIEPANAGTTLYTPTIYPSGGSCIEVSTAYFHTSQVVAAWDWCVQIRFVVQIPIDRAFMRKYTVDKNYSTQIVRTKSNPNTWTAFLYNYKKDRWETMFTQSGMSQVGLTQGWDLYELYSDIQGNGQSYACADLKGKRIESQGIQVLIGSTWQIADASNAGDDYDVPLSEFHCSSLTYQMITPFSHWKAIG